MTDTIAGIRLTTDHHFYNKQIGRQDLFVVD